MPTGSTTFSGAKYRFNISYSYTNTSFKITGVTTTCLEGGWAAWDLMPSLYLYILKGRTPVSKSWQTEYTGDTAKNHITSNGGTYENYHGNTPSSYLSNSTGGVVTWSSSSYSGLTMSLSGSSVTITVGSFIINTTGTLNDVTYGYTTFTLNLYKAPSGYVLQIIDSTVDTITAKHSWTNGSDSISTRTITIGDDVQTVNNGSSYTFTGLKSNTKYTVDGKISDSITTLTGTDTRWTYPKIKSLVLSLPSGEEHDEISAKAIPDVSSNYDQFSFKIDSNEFSVYSDDATKLYSGLEGHSTHSITSKMKNTDSAYESEEVTESITTWYDPIYSLSVTLVNKWFWFISTKATFDYQGGVENIKKYEFSIGNEAYQDKDTINAYSKGTTTPGESDNLAYNTDYICKVKLTDNHGRTKEASATFKTLDERPLFVNGTLREVKVIKPDGSVHYITPNLLSVVKPDNSVINMNKIINGDDRTEYK